MSDWKDDRYPNMAACAQGCASGRWSDWPVLRQECRDALAEIRRLQAENKRMREAGEQMRNTLDVEVQFIIGLREALQAGRIIECGFGGGRAWVCRKIEESTVSAIAAWDAAKEPT